MYIVHRQVLILYIYCIASFSINAHREIYLLHAKQLNSLVYYYIWGYLSYSIEITAFSISLPISFIPWIHVWFHNDLITFV